MLLRILLLVLSFASFASSGKAVYYSPRWDWQRIAQRQGVRIACPEEIALRLGYISLDQFYKTIQNTAKSSYGEYLLSVYHSFAQ